MNSKTEQWTLEFFEKLSLNWSLICLTVLHHVCYEVPDWKSLRAITLHNQLDWNNASNYRDSCSVVALCGQSVNPVYNLNGQ